MKTKLHRDPVVREKIIARYLVRELDPAMVEAFEDHYLACGDCYEQVCAAELLICGLSQADLELTHRNGVAVVRFGESAELTGSSSELSALARMVHVSGDTKVLIDLSKVSRIDSAGLGLLMRFYTHAVRNAGMLKLLNPNSQVRKVLSITGVNSVVSSFEDEKTALQSFEKPA